MKQFTLDYNMPFTPYKPINSFTPYEPVQPEQKAGGFKGLVQDIFETPLNVASTIASAGRGLYETGKAGVQYATGNKSGAFQSMIRASEPVKIDFGYLGEGRPIESTKEAIGSGLELGGYVIPVNQAIGRVAQASISGALFGAGGALQEDKSAMDIAKQTAIGGAVGAGIGLASVGAGKLFKLVTEKLPKRLVQSAIGQPKGELMAGKDISEYVLSKNKMGTAESILKGSSQAIDDLSKQINNKLGKEALKTTRILQNDIAGKVSQKINAGGGDMTTKEVVDVLQKLAPQARGLLNKKSLSLTEANLLRQALDKTLGDRAFLSSQLPFNKGIMKEFDNFLREKVKTLAPAGTREMFKELSKEITLRDALLGRMATQSKNQVINAFDLILGLGGGVAGGPITGVSLFATKKLGQSTIGKTTGAVALNQLGNKLQPILQKVEPSIRTAILKIISEITD